MTHQFHGFSVPALEAGDLPLSAYTGKVVLVVNTASQCGFTEQFAGLEALYQRYKEQGLVVIGFPCNQFGRQDPGTASEIGAFCQRHYGVSFPMAAKVEVNGPDTAPLWRYLKQQRPGCLWLGRIHWNFTKFLIDRQGRVVSRHAPFIKPGQLTARIEALLAKRG